MLPGVNRTICTTYHVGFPAWICTMHILPNISQRQIWNLHNDLDRSRHRSDVCRFLYTHHVNFVRGELERPSRHVPLRRVIELDERRAPVGAVTLDGEPAQVAGQEVRGFVAHASLLEIVLWLFQGGVVLGFEFFFGQPVRQ